MKLEFENWRASSAEAHRMSSQWWSDLVPGSDVQIKSSGHLGRIFNWLDGTKATIIDIDFHNRSARISSPLLFYTNLNKRLPITFKLQQLNPIPHDWEPEAHKVQESDHAALSAAAKCGSKKETGWLPWWPTFEEEEEDEDDDDDRSCMGDL